MKTTVTEIDKIKVSAGTYALMDCLAGLASNYEEIIKSLNTAFGSNEISARMFTQEYLPAFLELQKVIKGFIAESVTRKLDGDEMDPIEKI